MANTSCLQRSDIISKARVHHIQEYVRSLEITSLKLLQWQGFGARMLPEAYAVLNILYYKFLLLTNVLLNEDVQYTFKNEIIHTAFFFRAVPFKQLESRKTVATSNENNIRELRILFAQIYFSSMTGLEVRYHSRENEELKGREEEAKSPGSVIVAGALYFMSGNVFVVSLAVADLIVAIYPYPLVLTSVFHNGWKLGYLHCQISGFLMGLSVIGSIFNITGIAINRYCYICHSLKYDKLYSDKNSLCYVVLIWVLTFVAIVPNLFVGSLQYDPRIYSCTFAQSVSSAYTIAVVFFHFLLPIAVVTFCYLRIWILVIQKMYICIMSTYYELVQDTVSNIISDRNSGPVTPLPYGKQHVKHNSPDCKVLCSLGYLFVMEGPGNMDTEDRCFVIPTDLKTHSERKVVAGALALWLRLSPQPKPRGHGHHQAKHGRPSRAPAAAAQRHRDEPAVTDVTSAKAGAGAGLEREMSLLGARHGSLGTGSSSLNKGPTLKEAQFLDTIYQSDAEKNLLQEVASRNPGGELDLLDTVVLTAFLLTELLEKEYISVEDERATEAELGSTADLQALAQWKPCERETRGKDRSEDTVPGHSDPLTAEGAARTSLAEYVFQVYQKVTEILSNYIAHRTDVLESKAIIIVDDGPYKTEALSLRIADLTDEGRLKVCKS
ncbi:hypothetical protein IHE44_0013063 [Lamprotornis superbus]|uniref:G-protein coupled receptors family 1 profile domain-containing protein n=2 Tax=Passeriformes TaxID=9126 RepID=A0A835P7D5_9PASS|nr:hypothetical protein IHE44_0013063 [Lamprotornis superbus]